VNLPKPVPILARLLVGYSVALYLYIFKPTQFLHSNILLFNSQVLAGHPLAGKERGTHVLGLLRLLSPILHSEIEELWDTVLPKLIKYVEGEEKAKLMGVVEFG
jgi:hypothetical protein